VAIRVVRAAVLTGLFALAFMLLVVVGSAIATDGDASPSYARPRAESVPTRIVLVADTTVVVAQSDTARAPAQGTVVQKSGPAAAATARTIDIVVVSALVFLGLWVWVRVGNTRKGH
jgi:hypothetical protein